MSQRLIYFYRRETEAQSEEVTFLGHSRGKARFKPSSFNLVYTEDTNIPLMCREKPTRVLQQKFSSFFYMLDKGHLLGIDELR